MGSDLFGSFAEATCAALVIASSSPELNSNIAHVLFPLTITGTGIIVSLLVSLLVYCTKITKHNIELTLKIQLIVSTVIMIGVFAGLCAWLIPETFTLTIFNVSSTYGTYGPFWAAFCGCLSGLIIGLVTEYFTSSTYRPVQELIENCLSEGGNSATNIVYGLALGYLSCIVPVICLAITIYVSNITSGMFGIAIAALGMLSTMATALTIDAFGPISDNSGGIAEMSLGGDEFRVTRKVTDTLDAAGNTTAAVGKGFAIGSAGLVSLALFSAFITRVD